MHIIFSLQKITLTFFLTVWVYTSSAQYIQYRDKRRPSSNTTTNSQHNPIPVPDKTIKVTTTKPLKDTIEKPVAIKEDTSQNFKKNKSKITINAKPKKQYVEDQNMCNLMSRPEVAPTLPLIINNVSPEMIAVLKERYKGRLYSITGLNMIDVRLKYKLKICDKDQGKFRSEYLDKDGKVVNDPDLDYE